MSPKICAAKNPIFSRFGDPKWIVSATPFHNTMEIGKSNTIDEDVHTAK